MIQLDGAGKRLTGLEFNEDTVSDELLSFDDGGHNRCG